MSGIQGLSSDQQQVYNQLINDAGTVNVSRAAVDKELQVAMDAGLSFQEAAAQVRNDLPTLTPPKSSSGSLGGWVGVASPMASINALITEMSAEQRKENREVMKAQTDSIAMSMEQQADEIRKKAVAQLVCGVVFFGAMLCRDGLRENPVQAEIDLYNRSLEALTRDIVDVSERCGEDTSEMKTIIRDISNDTVPLYEQLPDELGDEKKARILKKYFNLKLKAVRQLRALLSDADE